LAVETLQALAVQQGKAGGFLAVGGHEPPHQTQSRLRQWQQAPTTPLLLSVGSLHQKAVQQALNSTPYQALAVGLNPSQQNKAQSLLKAPFRVGVNTEPTPNSPFVPLITPPITPLAAPLNGGTLSVQRFVWANARWPALKQTLAQHTEGPCLLLFNSAKEGQALRAFLEKTFPQRPLHSLPPQPTLAQAQGFLKEFSAGSIGLLPFTLWPWCGAWLPANSPTTPTLPLPAIGWGVPPQAALLWGGGDLTLQLLQAGTPSSTLWARWLRRYASGQGHPFLAEATDTTKAYTPWQRLGWQAVETAKMLAQWLP
jgi:hypothetical protein